MFCMKTDCPDLGGVVQYYKEIVRQLAALTQFGLSLITPTLMCLALCWWLNTKAGLGVWVYLPGFFFGLGGSGMFAYKTYLMIGKKQKKEEKNKKKTVSFNQHE